MVNHKSSRKGTQRFIFYVQCPNEDGLSAFGRGKKVICMNGRDIHEALSRSIPLDRVIIEKARQAASQGPIFKRVSDMLHQLVPCLYDAYHLTSRGGPSDPEQCMTPNHAMLSAAPILSCAPPGAFMVMLPACVNWT